MLERRFVWMDLEMTGLDPADCVILEVGVIITNAELLPLATYEAAVWQPDPVLATMSPFVREMHTRNGLLGRVTHSKTDISMVERDVLGLLATHCRFREGVLAGNSIHTDRRFLLRYMPSVEKFLHYRQLDVSSLKVLAQAWAPELEFVKTDKHHTALDDLRASLDELEHYRRHFFRKP
ncbi:MAG: oligoribonuclease [Myxococcales bacterium]|jgi:oligoribonuclease